MRDFHVEKEKYTKSLGKEDYACVIFIMPTSGSINSTRYWEVPNEGAESAASTRKLSGIGNTPKK